MFKCFSKEKCKQPCCEERRYRAKIDQLIAVERTLSEQPGNKVCECGALKNQKKFLGIFGRKKRRVPEVGRQVSESESDGNGPTIPAAAARQFLPQYSVSKYSPHYNMGHPERGKAVIFNFDSFSNTSPSYTLDLKPRLGSQKDRDDLHRTLTNMDFDVHVYNNLNWKQFCQVIGELRDEDHRRRDCIVVAIMSHGEKNHIYLSDGTLIPVNNVWHEFQADVCPTLAGKPKIFIIQACRGKNYDHGTRLVEDQQSRPSASKNDVTDFAPFSYVIPNAADIFVAFSCPLGHYSWRNPTEGSWFIQAVCKVFNKEKYNVDLHELFTRVGLEVAVNRESATPDDPESDKKVQVPSVSHTLIRTVNFQPKPKPEPLTLQQIAEINGVNQPFIEENGMNMYSNASQVPEADASENGNIERSQL